MRGRKLRGVQLESDVGGSELGESLILTSSTGAPIEPGNFARTFYLLSEKAKLRRITVHQTRHTAATLLKSMGVQARDVQLILGHANVSTTQQLYQHGFVEEHFAALSQVADTLAHHPNDPLLNSSGATDGHASRQLTANASSEATFTKARQRQDAKENGRPTEVATADFFGGSGGTRTHDILLKSDLLGLLTDLPTSDIRRLQARTRQRILGHVAVKLGRQEPILAGAFPDSSLTDLLDRRRLLRGALMTHMGLRSFPFHLTYPRSRNCEE